MKRSKMMMAAAVGLLLVLSLALVACNGGGGGTPVGISLDETALSLTIGESRTLTAIDADGTVEWTTDDVSVATVTDGTVTAVGIGTAVITATANNGTADCVVTVSPTSTPLSIVLSKNALDIKVGEDATLLATVLEGTAVVEADVTFTSENAQVVSTDGGKATGVSAGSTRIAVKASYQGKTETVYVSVTVRPDAELTLAAESFSLSVFELDDKDVKSTSAGAAVKRNGQAVPGVTYQYVSSAPAVFSVSADGTLTALKKGDGELTVTASVQGGELTARVPVSVVHTKAVEFSADFGAYDRAMLNCKQTGYDLTQTLSATVEPYADGLEVEWVSSSDAIVTVEGEGTEATVTAVENCRGGEATVSLYVEGIEAGSAVIGVYFPVSSEDDLLAIDDSAEALQNWYLLTNDIVLAHEYDAPLITQNVGEKWNASFKGMLDGNGYTVSEFKVGAAGRWNNGLVGYNVGTIRNLCVKTTTSPKGSGHRDNIRSKSGAIVAQNEGVVENCKVVVDMVQPQQNNACGGAVVGVLSGNGVVRNCYTEVQVHFILDQALSAGLKVGAIVGCLYSGTIENCWSVKQDTDLIDLYGLSALNADETATATEGNHVATTKAALIEDGFGADALDDSIWTVTVEGESFTAELKKGCMSAVQVTPAA